MVKGKHTNTERERGRDGGRERTDEVLLDVDGQCERVVSLIRENIQETKATEETLRREQANGYLFGYGPSEDTKKASGPLSVSLSLHRFASLSYTYFMHTCIHLHISRN